MKPGSVWRILIIMGTLTTAVPSQGEPRTLLAIFAHADDETIIAPLLSRYAREGVRVHLAIATNGDKGVREGKTLPAMKIVSMESGGAADLHSDNRDSVEIHNGTRNRGSLDTENGHTNPDKAFREQRSGSCSESDCRWTR